MLPTNVQKHASYHSTIFPYFFQALVEHITIPLMLISWSIFMGFKSFKYMKVIRLHATSVSYGAIAQLHLCTVLCDVKPEKKCATLQN